MGLVVCQKRYPNRPIRPAYYSGTGYPSGQGARDRQGSRWGFCYVSRTT